MAEKRWLPLHGFAFYSRRGAALQERLGRAAEEAGEAPQPSLAGDALQEEPGRAAVEAGEALPAELGGSI